MVYYLFIIRKLLEPTMQKARKWQSSGAGGGDQADLLYLLAQEKSVKTLFWKQQREDRSQVAEPRMNEGNLHQQTADILASHSKVAGFILPHFFKSVFFPSFSLWWSFALVIFTVQPFMRKTLQVCICMCWIPVLLVGVNAGHS